MKELWCGVKKKKMKERRGEQVLFECYDLTMMTLYLKDWDKTSLSSLIFTDETSDIIKVSVAVVSSYSSTKCPILSCTL